MKIRVVESQLSQKLVHTRIPFKFGAHVLRAVPLAEMSVSIEIESGGFMHGRSSDLLMPKWFEKNPERSPQEDSEALADSAREASQIALAHSGGTAFEIWESVYSDHVGGRDHNDSDALVKGFGAAMVERAMIDAVCHASGLSFYGALSKGVLGFDSARVIEETRGWDPASLPPPARTIDVRHTVGMLDPLVASDISSSDGVRDGLPHALDEDIASYGLKWFKIKVCGDPLADSERLRDIARVVFDHAGDDFRFTLDGNEQCTDLDSFAEMLIELRPDPVCGRLIEKIVLIEQPLPRGTSFGDSSGIKHLSQIAPVIIDEADTDAGAFARAIDTGYSGVSIKACKGVFRAVANRALIDVRGDKRLFQSGEDLTNLGSIPLQQDLALQATLGMTNVERNGHHYFRGLEHLSTQSCSRLSESHPKLYVVEDGLTHLRISNGSLDLESLIDQVGFGGTLGSIDGE